MDATTWALLLLILGLLFLVLEFFIPSGGALAVLCALSLLAAIIVGFMAGPWTGLGILITEAVVVPGALVAAVKWWPETPIGRLMLIPRPNSSDDVLPDTEAYRGLNVLVGRRGTARGTMVPSGIVVIDGRPYDAVSEGTAIEAHQTVLVVAISTQRLVGPPRYDDPRRTGRRCARLGRDEQRPDGRAVADPFAE